uniref:NADH dehydrogenase subunit 2 n=1 Tax=Symplocodes ridleyi TaxID=2163934 RepID=UPI0027A01E43|nr:NADH dehydrogenase subunit 2 [Symplocodes ridleyi]WGO57730.1 NADH dehydrogenase subunit 2 [Symplocodes ridleyi]
MSNNSTKILFIITLISGILITISSNSWLNAWMGLEINLLSFIPLMTSQENIYTTEASLKYFLIQALASTILLFAIMSKTMIENMFSMSPSSLLTLLATPLFLKSGVAPFHWWFPSVMEGLSWLNCLILLTIQKISPLILISYLIKTSAFMTMIILSSVIIGALGGFNQTSIRKILTYSSINHMGWLILAMLLGENFWLTYFTFYTLLTMSIISIISPFQVSFINQTFSINNNNQVIKYFIFSSFLSLGGLPPFLGFIPKWVIIQTMANNYSFWMITIMVLASLITLYYYLRIAYSAFLILNMEPAWNLLNYKTPLNSNVQLSIMSNLGMLILTSIMLFF